ncbi:hypothetical protein B5S28_g4551 [[Candida] boidinii]|nr:hypothetical protein B5S28_g4551 [[Candida] boidinii]OWB71895.1 hypothetical protein B5S31_g1592 [[Candida] boidinii]GME69808.1 unnamed protein product [[Candida] boidinii]
MEEEKPFVKESNKFTKSVTATLTPMFGEPFQVAVTLPSQKPALDKRNSVPINCHISSNGCATEFGCCIYSIPRGSRSGDGDKIEILQSVVNNSEDSLFDSTKRLSYLICKKFNCPTYLSVSGQLQIDDQMMITKEVMLFLNQSIAELDD